MECARGWFSSTPGSVSCEMCPAELPFSNAVGSASIDDCTRPPEECVEIHVVGCADTAVESSVTGFYEIYDGECGDDTFGLTPYYDPVGGLFTFYHLSHSAWMIGPECGGGVAQAYGNEGMLELPFLDTAPEWSCQSTGGEVAWVTSPMSIECSAHDFHDQLMECKPGSWNSSGVGLGGNCFPCPAKMSSMPGSNSFAACFNPATNLFVSSKTMDSLAAYNNDDQFYSLLQEGGELRQELDEPKGITFLNSSVLIIANYANNNGVENSNVLLATVEGDVVGVFATATRPNDVLYLNETDTVAVAGGEGNADLGIYFFQVDDYEHRGTLEGGDAEFVSIGDQRYSTLYSDQYSELIGAGEPKSMCKGEGEGEILVTTKKAGTGDTCDIPDMGEFDTNGDGVVDAEELEAAQEAYMANTGDISLVVRVCIPNTACDASERTAIMLYGGGQDLMGIVKLDDTYLVADRKTITGIVYQCPIGRCSGRTTCTPPPSSLTHPSLPQLPRT